jgi:ATP-dependent helicase/nuclease subunit A
MRATVMNKPRIKAIPRETEIEQAKASNPLASVWVSANAGSGKTHVLAERVIRLLLEGVNPSCVVCLTYTKAAAALMANRVFERLSKWTGLSDEELSAEIGKLDGIAPGPARLSEARRLFARALETPGGLKIQTIHAFCQMILGRFPLEANIAGRFDLVDDEAAGELMKEARRLLLQAVRPGEADPLSAAVFGIIAKYGEHGLEKLLESARESRLREALAAFARDFTEGGESAARLGQFLEIGEEEDEASIAAEAWPLPSVTMADLQHIGSLAGSLGGKLPAAFAAKIASALVMTDPLPRIEQLREVLNKEGGVSNKDAVAKGLSASLPQIHGLLDGLEADLAANADKLKRLETARLSAWGFRVIGAFLRHYGVLKARRSLLDHDDVIDRTVKLLTQSDAAAWVQFKLDQGIDHILVDEAQDTSPAQWRVILALAEEFFAGETARAKGRTLFAVGDEKQSIYSFQGARPEVFAKTGREIKRRAKDAGMKYDDAKLNLSFRSAHDVLKAVDQVFARPGNRQGLSFDGVYNDHEPIREHGPGRVEIWPLAAAEETAETPEDWTQGGSFETKPAVKLAVAIAAEIERWIKGGQVNEATGKVIQPGDIMVLVRRRGPLVHALSRELKNRQIPVSGADRLKLTGHIAVKDLIAIANFCLLPDDSLSLAALLRSPVFGLADDELTDLAAGRAPQKSLYDMLLGAAGSSPKLAAIADELARWRAESAQLPVFDFFARLLGRDEVRARLMQRLGVEAGDVIDEFLNHSLASETAGLSGLQEFVETMLAAEPEIKREMNAVQNEVRIMTVHAAKGQEAPIVFLVEPPPVSIKHANLFAVSESPPLFVWEPAAGLANSKTRAFHASRQDMQAQEFRRLLYVGMTRAEDRLIICGFASKKQSKNAETWLAMVRDSLAPQAAFVRTAPHPSLEGETLIWQTTSEKAPEPDADEDDSAEAPPLPAGMLAPLPAARHAARPLSPSSASLIIEPETMPPQDASPVSGGGPDAPSAAIRRGLATHKLLEVLPGLPQEDWEESGARYLERAVPDLAQASRALILEKVLSVLRQADFAPAFAPGSQAEVPIMGRLRIRGEERVISGKIDRIAVSADEVLLIDYKTNALPPDVIPQTYAAQMALYRALVQPLYPGRKVSAALLFTETATLRSLDPAMLDAALEALTDS